MILRMDMPICKYTPLLKFIQRCYSHSAERSVSADLNLCLIGHREEDAGVSSNIGGRRVIRTRMADLLKAS